MNTLTNAGVMVEDRLFATLDTRTKKWAMERGIEALLSDTVGFIRHLPHQLVASFKATLEETVNADLLLHVVDISSNEVFEQIESVETVLEEIGCGDKEKIVLLNKADIVAKRGLLESLETVYPDAVCISAKTGMNLDKLAQAVLEKYKKGEVVVRLRCHPADGKVQSYIQANAVILKREFTDDAVLIEARLGKTQLPGLKRLWPGQLDILET
jgi:GTP-binding protein HflX